MCVNVGRWGKRREGASLRNKDSFLLILFSFRFSFLCLWRLTRAEDLVARRGTARVFLRCLLFDEIFDYGGWILVACSLACWHGCLLSAGPLTTRTTTATAMITQLQPRHDHDHDHQMTTKPTATATKGVEFAVAIFIFLSHAAVL